jgi:hypothetical protein
LPLARPRCLLILHIPKQRSLFHQPSSKGRAYKITTTNIVNFILHCHRRKLSNGLSALQTAAAFGDTQGRKP